jgi:ABC-type anion transport system duplicated permease subunit
VADTSGLAQILESYGPWGLVAVLMVTCGALFRAYVVARDKNDTTLQAQVKGTTELVEEMTRAAVEQKNALMQLTGALSTFERRLENVERRSRAKDLG